jgi:hypothetical protein
MKLELKVSKELEDISDDQNGGCFLGLVEICGAPHHLQLLRVCEDGDGVQVAADPEYQGAYEELQVLYAGKYLTFEIPGLAGQYIAFMHPSED